MKSRKRIYNKALINKMGSLLPIFMAMVVLTLISSAASAGENKKTGLTFHAAVKKALTDNPDIKAAEAEITGNQAAKRKSSAIFMPVIDLYTDFIKGDSPSAALFTSIDKRELNPTADFNNPGEFRNFESGVKAHMTIFNGGKNILRAKAANDHLLASKEGKKAIVNQVMANVVKRWFNVESARRFIGISEETAETIKKQLEIMEVRYKGGSLLKSDILALKVRLAEAKEEVIRNRSRYNLAKASLAVLLGFSPEKYFEIEGQRSVFKRFEEKILKAGASHALLRPELTRAEKMVTGAEKSAVIAGRNYLPSIQFSGKYYLDDEDMNYSANRENWTVGIMMNWNLFSGFSELADRQRAAADLAAAREAKRKAELSIKLDLKRAFLMLKEAKARLAVSEKYRELAKESLMLVKKQYEGGAVSVARYLDAELAFSKAKTRFATAECDKILAVTETARAGGLLADPFFLIRD